jgi:anti-sigma regulatory factor (Ser/Thr protein kinase)
MLHEPSGGRGGFRMTAPATYQASAIEQTVPALDLADPQPVDARRAARQLLDGSSVSAEAAENIVGALSEVVTNASLHGRPPVRVLGWVFDGSATFTVSDHGEGPSDPEAGLRPAERAPGEGGYGLWLARQMCSEMTMGRHDGLFTVRLVEIFA